ncbi:type VI secretion system contractile sheath small subunit [Aeromonas hydrophila]|uniref:Type VI secretion system contractile sheath small subunit n=1 Tax=Aeromonas hydrophila TaxID=644 RepID=A0A926FM01_AERHY|nr:type VI secretion system contractile sheath small subunit [Aeromonas hydrophila]
MMVVGNMKGRTEDTPIEERQTVSIDKNNFVCHERIRAGTEVFRSQSSGRE